MPDTVVEKREHEWITEAVVGQLAIHAETNEAHRPHGPKLVGGRRDRKRKRLSEIADAQLLLRERSENSHSGRVSDDLECVGNPLNEIVGKHVLADTPYPIFVDEENLAATVSFAVGAHCVPLGRGFLGHRNCRSRVYLNDRSYVCSLGSNLRSTGENLEPPKRAR